MKEITPEKVKKMLAEQGTEVTVEEAQTILTFMTDLATIELEGIFENESIVSIAQQSKKTSV